MKIKPVIYPRVYTVHNSFEVDLEFEYNMILCAVVLAQESPLFSRF